MPNYRSPGVYVEEVQAGSRPIEGVGTAIAAFVGITETGPYNEPIKVTNWGQYVKTFGEWVDGAYLPNAVYQYFNNSGGACYVVRVGENAADEPQRAGAELTSSVRAGQAVYRIEAREPGSAGEGITVNVEPRAAEPAPEAKEGEPPADSAEDTFTVVVRQGDKVERFPDLSPRKGRKDLVSELQRSTLVRATEITGVPVADRVPSAGQIALRGGGELPVRLTPDDYLGDETARSGIEGLSAIDDVTMIAVPDLMAAYEAGQIDLDGVHAVQGALIAHCESMKDRMAILDAPKGLNAQQVREWAKEKARFSSPYATLYWPWCSFYDPGLRRARLMPPSGAIAGIWGRNDDTRGVHKAPANEVVAGALDLELNVNRREHDDLNPAGINVIRAFPGRGILVWGARTLSDDTAWRYVNVRRLFNYVESSILAGTQWVVFEPNDLDLWQRIKRTVSSFLLGLWRDGALFGATPDQAYYVKCDAETNPPDVIDAGYVVIEVGIAPVKPAEFVVFRIAQLPSGGGVQE
ncbi:MAG TPA: phage tail sheath subtilisin-like domain-containing protein [Micromonosporaceae bacterium]|nr:phage tail sheath subtilisin-like domain-containing protein [Micromonosporaceae bacterium]